MTANTETTICLRRTVGSEGQRDEINRNASPPMIQPPIAVRIAIMDRFLVMSAKPKCTRLLVPSRALDIIVPQIPPRQMTTDGPLPILDRGTTMSSLAASANSVTAFSWVIGGR